MNGPGSITRFIDKRKEATTAALRSGLAPEFEADMLKIDLERAVAAYAERFGFESLSAVVISAAATVKEARQ